jgi:hypothetical protein
MSRSDEFRQYAEEAMRWAREAKTEKDKAILIDIARTWITAATYREDTEKKGRLSRLSWRPLIYIEDDASAGQRNRPAPCRGGIRLPPKL